MQQPSPPSASTPSSASPLHLLLAAGSPLLALARPPAWGGARLFFEFAHDGLGTLHRMFIRYGDVVRWPMPHDEVQVLYPPEGRMHLLQDSSWNWSLWPVFSRSSPSVH